MTVSLHECISLENLFLDHKRTYCRGLLGEYESIIRSLSKRTDVFLVLRSANFFIVSRKPAYFK